MACDPRIVETPAFFPQACICGSQKRPMADTGIEKAGIRIYVCETCAKLVAIAYGFAEGEELDRLQATRSEFDRYERELHEKDGAIADLRSEVASLEREREAEQTRAEKAEASLATERSKLQRIDETVGLVVGHEVR